MIKSEKIRMELEEEDFSVYETPEEKGYCDKGGHLSRSIANDTRRGKSHRRHFGFKGDENTTHNDNEGEN